MVVDAYLVHHDTLLQNATGIITKCGSYFIKKCDKSLLLNVSVFLQQNTSVLLQNVMIVLQNTKCSVYYKMRQYKLNSAQLRKKTWLVLTFVICLHIQLSSIYSIVTH